MCAGLLMFPQTRGLGHQLVHFHRRCLSIGTDPLRLILAPECPCRIHPAHLLKKTSPESGQSRCECGSGIAVGLFVFARLSGR